MLISAIDCDSKSVIIDILTEKDVSLLKSKKNRNNTTNNTSTSQSILDNSANNISNTNNPGRRYVIMTYNNEFDKVHYPLPLYYEEFNIKDQVATIQALKSELNTNKTKQTAPSQCTIQENTTFQTSAAPQDPKFSTTNTFLVNSIAQDENDLKKIQDENLLLKERCKKLEQGTFKKTAESVKLGAVDQEMMFKSMEQFDFEKRKLIEEQKRELIVFNDTIKELQYSLKDKDNEIYEWKEISENNIKMGGNSALRDQKLKTKEIETLKRQVQTQKSSEMNLKKKNLELDKENTNLKKKDRLPMTSSSYTRESPIGSRQFTSPNIVTYSKGSSKKYGFQRDKSRGSNTSAQKSNRSNTPNSRKGDNESNTPSRNYIKNNFIQNGTGSRNNSQNKAPTQSNPIFKMSPDNTTNNIKNSQTTNFLQRNKQALKSKTSMGYQPSPRGSDPRNCSLRSITNSKEPTPRNSFKIKQSPSRSREPNYIGRRKDRSNSRDISKGNNKSVNKSLNDSVDEKRKKVLGERVGGKTGGVGFKRYGNILPELGLS